MSGRNGRAIDIDSTSTQACSFVHMYCFCFCFAIHHSIKDRAIILLDRATCLMIRSRYVLAYSWRRDSCSWCIIWWRHTSWFMSCARIHTSTAYTPCHTNRIEWNRIERWFNHLCKRSSLLFVITGYNGRPLTQRCIDSVSMNNKVNTALLSPPLLRDQGRQQQPGR